MKTKDIRIKMNHLKLVWLILLAFLFAFSACNTATTKNDKKSELSDDTQNVNAEEGFITDKERQELKKHLDSVLLDFNNKVNAIERKIKKDNTKLNYETQEMLNNLKAQRDSLYRRIDEIEGQSKESWESFKNEVEHDTEQFTSSVADFFKDNK